MKLLLQANIIWKINGILTGVVETRESQAWSVFSRFLCNSIKIKVCGRLHRCIEKGDAHTHFVARKLIVFLNM